MQLLLPNLAVVMNVLCTLVTYNNNQNNMKASDLLSSDSLPLGERHQTFRRNVAHLSSRINKSTEIDIDSFETSESARTALYFKRPKS